MELFNQIDELKQELETFLPYVRLHKHTLTHHTSLLVCISLDEPDSWNLRIFENSNYAKISISDGKIEIISRHYQTAKMRKANVKTVQDVVKKVKKWKEDSLIVP